MPVTLDMRLFWASLAMFFIMLYLAPKISRHASERFGAGRAKAIVFACTAMLFALVLLYPLSRWSCNDNAFGQVFAWFCGHGFAALLFLRMSVMMLRNIRQKDSRTVTPDI